MHVTELYTPSKYNHELEKTGFRMTQYCDLSHHLAGNYANMIEKINQNETTLIQSGLTLEQLNAYKKSLGESEQICGQHEPFVGNCL